MRLWKKGFIVWRILSLVMSGKSWAFVRFGTCWKKFFIRGWYFIHPRVRDQKSNGNLDSYQNTFSLRLGSDEGVPPSAPTSS